jgi:site-specific DNA recombinase
MGKQSKIDTTAERLPWDVVVRISKARRDSDGKLEVFGVDRQVPPCRRKVEELGGYVAKVHIANDLSGWSGDFRFPDAADRLKRGEITGICAWAQDRITAQMDHWTALSFIAQEAGGRIHTVQDGEIDVATPGGELLGNIRVAISRFERSLRSARNKLKHDELAQRGAYKGGSRPFGFEPDGITHRKAEAKRLRDAAQKVLRGAKLGAIVKQWDKAGVRTATGAHWRTSQLKRTLLSPRVVGLREHHGQVMTDADGKPVHAVWRPILAADVDKAVALQERLRRELESRTTPHGTGGPAGMARTYLLSGGYAVCGYPDCGKPLTTTTSSCRVSPANPTGRYRSYVCKSGPPGFGCGRITRAAAGLEAYVEEVVMELLNTREVDMAIRAAGADDGRVAQLQADEQHILDLIDEYDDHLAVRRWTPQKYDRQVARRQAELAPIQDELARLQSRRRAAPMVRYGETPEWAWRYGDLDVKRALLGTVVSKVIVRPGRNGRGGFRRDLIDFIPVDDIASLEVVQLIVKMTRAATE